MDYEKVNAVGLMAIRALRALEARGAWGVEDVLMGGRYCPLCEGLSEIPVGSPIPHKDSCPARLAEEALVAANEVAMRGANLDVKA